MQVKRTITYPIAQDTLATSHQFCKNTPSLGKCKKNEAVQANIANER